MSERRASANAAAGRMTDAFAGVLRRHVGRRPAPNRDRWLLEEVRDLARLAARVASTQQRSAPLLALAERAQLRLDECPPLQELSPAALASLLDQQRSWYQDTSVGRPRATRRPAQLRRLGRALGALCDEVMRRGTLPRLQATVPSLRALVSRLDDEELAVTALRADTTPPRLAATLRQEALRLRREATLLLENATPGTEAVRAASRWLDRAWELEIQWLSCSAALPPERRFIAWTRHQNLSFRVRRTLVLP